MIGIVATVALFFTIGVTWARPIDDHVTTNTRHLYHMLLNFTHNSQKFMFGQHGATLNGAYNGHAPYYIGTQHNGTKGWRFTNTQASNHLPDDLCDMKSVIGEYPGIMEFDLGNMDSDTLQKTAYLVQRAVDRNQVVSISWHMLNPISNAPYSFYVKQDHSGLEMGHIIQRMLPGGDTSQKFNATLDVVADWIKGLKYSNGKQASVIFRPFHEMNGNWFWWGTNVRHNNTPTDYKHLYQYVVRYIRDVRRAHNILYAFSPLKPHSKTHYLEFYPGDDYVDILGMDFYYNHPFSPSLQTFRESVKVVTDLAKERQKIAALTEVGIQNYGLDAHADFWVDHVLEPLKTGSGTMQIAFALTWDNFCTTHCEVRIPYHGHPAERSFLEFYNDPVTAFESHVNQFVSLIG